MVRAKTTSRNRRIYLVLMGICIIGFWLFDNFYTPDTYSDSRSEEMHIHIPLNFYPTSTTGVIVEHSYFVLSYNEPYEQAEWVAYTLNKKHITNDQRNRPYFIEDPKVPSKSADWRNYRSSGYDRGHLCPAGDRRFSEQAYNETFYTSNISPQKGDFNAGVWNRLEMKIRQWAKRYDEVFIVTGGVLEEGLEEIGDEDVDVPRYFYKIIARGTPENPKIMAFLFKAEESTRPLTDFVVSVDEVEALTGIDFFENLPDASEAILEKKINLQEWKF